MKRDDTGSEHHFAKLLFPSFVYIAQHLQIRSLPELNFYWFLGFRALKVK